jgi:hypothetical protein
MQERSSGAGGNRGIELIDRESDQVSEPGAYRQAKGRRQQILPIVGQKYIRVHLVINGRQILQKHAIARHALGIAD